MSNPVYAYGGILGQNVATVKQRLSYDPPQYNKLGEETFNEVDATITGKLNQFRVDLRRTNAGGTRKVDATFTTLYDLQAPYPKNVTIDGDVFNFIDVTVIQKRTEKRYQWALRRP